MKKAVLTGVLALASLLAVPGASLAAAAPTFTDHVIVPNVSIGQLKLNASPAAIRKSFPAKDCATNACDYTAAGGAWTVSVLFVKTSPHGKLFTGQISILATKPGTPLAALQTTRGIGIGSTAAQVKRAYPHVTGSTRTGGYSIVGPHNHGTTFEISDGRVTGISMHSVPIG